MRSNKWFACLVFSFSIVGEFPFGCKVSTALLTFSQNMYFRLWLLSQALIIHRAWEVSGKGQLPMLQLLLSWFLFDCFAFLPILGGMFQFSSTIDSVWAITYPSFSKQWQKLLTKKSSPTFLGPVESCKLWDRKCLAVLECLKKVTREDGKGSNGREEAGELVCCFSEKNKKTENISVHLVSVWNSPPPVYKRRMIRLCLQNYIL